MADTATPAHPTFHLCSPDGWTTITYVVEGADKVVIYFHEVVDGDAESGPYCREGHHVMDRAGARQDWMEAIADGYRRV